jgi:hypothetical protein
MKVLFIAGCYRTRPPPVSTTWKDCSRSISARLASRGLGLEVPDGHARDLTNWRVPDNVCSRLTYSPG